MWLMFGLGCNSPELSGFLEDRTIALCARHQRCDTLFDAGFADEAACVDALNAATDALASEGRLSCKNYNAEAASGCLAAVDDSACGTVIDLTDCEVVCGAG